MDELRETHIGQKRAMTGPSVAAQLQAAYEAVLAKRNDGQGEAR
jgi:hypothetical protein